MFFANGPFCSFLRSIQLVRCVFSLLTFDRLGLFPGFAGLQLGLFLAFASLEFGSPLLFARLFHLLADGALKGFFISPSKLISELRFLLLELALGRFNLLRSALEFLFAVNQRALDIRVAFGIV